MQNFDQSTKPTLRNTLLSKHLPGLKYVRQTFLEQIVAPSGYPFFEWCDRIYAVRVGTVTFGEDTGILYADLT